MRNGYESKTQVTKPEDFVEAYMETELMKTARKTEQNRDRVFSFSIGLPPFRANLANYVTSRLSQSLFGK